MCPIVEQLFLSSFREFVHDGHCLDHGLSGSCTKEMHAFSKLSVWYKIPIWFQNVVCPKTKDAFPKIQAWAYNRYSCLHRSLVLRNTREFLKDTTMADSPKTSHGKVNSHFFSLYRNYSNSLTLSNASELFWAEFLLSISKFMKIMNFVIACLLPSQNVKLGFSRVVVQLWESVPRSSFARTWKLSCRLFSRPDWLPQGLRGWASVCRRRRRRRMQSRRNLPYWLHRTPSNAQNTQHKLGVAFSYLERNKEDEDGRRNFL